LVILPKDIDAAQAIAALQPAFDRSLVHLATGWVRRCQKDRAQLWRRGDFWAITEVQQTKFGRAIHIVAAAGPLDHDMWADIEQWGRTVGCVLCAFTGRKGWLKRMPGYQLKTVTMVKEL
jgi:hypothetical protein